MKFILLLCFTGFFIVSCGDTEQKADQQTYIEQKESLQDKEKKYPLQFLSVIGDRKKNIIGQTVVRGTISNKALTAAYKDVRIKMLCYKDYKMVEEHEDVIGEVVKANGMQDFKIKYRLPKGTDSVALSVISAAVAETK